MAHDCRFSMAESEWSRDESEGDARYVATPDLHSDRRMYDIPPHIEARQMLSSANRSEMPPPDRKKSEKSPDGVKVRRGKQSSVHMCVKMYLVGLTTGFIALLCFVVYLVIQQNAIASQHQQIVHSKMENTSNPGATDLHQLRQQLFAVQDSQRIIMESLYKQWDAPTRTGVSTASTPTTTTGCDAGHHKHNGSCFFIVKATTPLASTVSMVACWDAKHGAKLASFRHYQVQNVLGILPWGTYWIDGFRKSQAEGFRYADGSPMNATWLTGTVGRCVSLAATAATTEWRVTPCNDMLPGYICQYKSAIN